MTSRKETEVLNKLSPDDVLLSYRLVIFDYFDFMAHCKNGDLSNEENPFEKEKLIRVSKTVHESALSHMGYSQEEIESIRMNTIIERARYWRDKGSC